MHRASIKGHVDCVKYLIEKGANVNIQDNNGGTPLFCAVYYGYMKVIDCLCINNSDLLIQDYNKNTVFDIACQRLTNEQLQIVQLYFNKIRNNQFNLCLAKYSLLENDHTYFRHNPNSLPNALHFSLYNNNIITSILPLIGSDLIYLKKEFTDNDKKIPKQYIPGTDESIYYSKQANQEQKEQERKEKDFYNEYNEEILLTSLNIIVKNKKNQLSKNNLINDPYNIDSDSVMMIKDQELTEEEELLEKQLKEIPTAPITDITYTQFSVIGDKERCAICYAACINKRFASTPEISRVFFKILKNYQKNEIGIKVVLEIVIKLFDNHPDLLSGFLYLLPPDYDQGQKRLHKAIHESEEKKNHYN